jgi:hypothetical protein
MRACTGDVRMHVFQPGVMAPKELCVAVGKRGALGCKGPAYRFGEGAGQGSHAPLPRSKGGTFGEGAGATRPSIMRNPPPVPIA